MEPNYQTGITTQGSLGGEKVAMRIDANSIAHLMSVLTDLYSDPELAVIREYSTNALDAHVESGQTRPIEITTPGHLSPYFKIKDYGVGLSVDDITNIYSQYGASTKRNTNEQVGMLGLGCKSALTYTQTFTLVAVKNGVKTSASVSRVEDGTGVVEIIDTAATDDPNGVEIIVPVKSGHQFETKAKHFFQFWEKGKVLVNGEDPANRNGWMQIDDDLFIVPGLNSDYVVMGNVAYPTETRITDDLGSKGLVAYVAIGAVNFTPSREALHYTPLTNSTMSDISGRYRRGLGKTIRKDIENASSPGEAAKRYAAWYQTFRYNYSIRNEIASVRYNNEVIPIEYTVQYIDYRPSRWGNKAQTHQWMTLQAMSEEHTMLIEGFDCATLSGSHRQKIQQFADDNKIAFNQVYLVDKRPGSPWTDSLTWHDWADVKKTKLPNAKQRTHVQKDPGYDIWDGKKWETIENPDANDEYIYYSTAEDFNFEGLRFLFPSAKIAKMPRNRWEKFAREHPNAKHASKAVAPVRDAIHDMLTEEDKIHLLLRGQSWIRLDPSKVEDKELAGLLVIMKNPSDNLKAYQQKCSYLKGMGVNVGEWRYNGSNKSVPAQANYRITTKYPLMKHLGHMTPEAHTYLYLNTVHNTKENA